MGRTARWPRDRSRPCDSAWQWTDTIPVDGPKSRATRGSTVDVQGLGELTEIGRGGFGIVYRAEDASHGRTVAVKVLRHSLDEEGTARFERECRTAGALSGHPNIVSIHGSGVTSEGLPYLVMDLLPGGSLAERVRSEGPLPFGVVIEVGVGLAGALAAAHGRGIVHRDVKPENVLFSSFGLPQLVDFGIARMASEFETRSGSISASLAHAAPEVIAGAKAEPSADLYSLASVLHFALSGSAPFQGDEEETLAPLIARISTAPPPDLREIGVPDPLAAVIERGLAKNPADREPTAEDFAEALRGAARELGQTPPVMPKATLAPDPRLDEVVDPDADTVRQLEGGHSPGSTRRRALWIGAAVSAVLAVIIGVVTLTGGYDNETAGSPTKKPTVSHVRVTDDAVVQDGLRSRRVYDLDRADGFSTAVTLRNTTTAPMKLIWFEAVPKKLAATVEDVDWSETPTGVVVDDPLVYWVVELGPGQKRELGWSTPIPEGVKANSAGMSFLVKLHRTTVDEAADEVLFATVALERKTGAQATDPGKTVGDPNDVIDSAVDTSGGGEGTTPTDSTGGGGTTVTRSDTPTTASQATTTRAPTTTTTAQPLQKPGTPSNVAVRSPSYVGATNNQVDVQLSWGAPSSGGKVGDYVIRHVQSFTTGCPQSAGSIAYSDSTTTGTSATKRTDTQKGCSWIRWEVAARNAAGTSNFVAATGTIPNVFGRYYDYHLVRAVGGYAINGTEGDCGVEPSMGCSTTPGAGTVISNGTTVRMNQQP